MGKEIGNIRDFECKQNSIRQIGPEVCKNNCKHFKYNNKKVKEFVI